ncbi:hypothetical protein PHYSODRAFT_338487 [Phytophthora sojae]|uniref:Uncharacterized protein n=1 Tax=Phytophthora sojae (strain P6497) TaxID=1094619 RepID=G5A502_PHYSP|nr:hypothetical protein PHYSODRAFT_338487 [Phytophthora sojae]EGZ09751.1 hypothetical protein PHYSODRAFT_338487 [Phytophthora sojae]|eukprot:XP_009534612.1 hypothetical protein PHYSODRAFT_338487 [Phytophthora sojae]
MPRERIPLSYTNAFKLQLVLDYIAAAKDGMTRKAFCTLRDVKRSTLQTWQRKLNKLIAVSERRGTAHPSRANRLTLGGSGRVSPSAPVKDAVVTFIKAARREEQVVTRDRIIAKAAELAPAFMEGKSVDAPGKKGLGFCHRCRIQPTAGNKRK